MHATIDQISRDTRSFVNRAVAGETIMIQDNGKLIAKLVATETSSQSMLRDKAMRQTLAPKRASSDIRRVKSRVEKSGSEMVCEDRR